MPYIFQTHDKRGRAHPRWRFQYTDHDGRRRTATGHTSKTVTRKLALRVQAYNDEIRKGFRPRPTSADKHASRPVTAVIEEYLAWGESQGGRGGRPWSKVHARLRRTRLAWWQECLGLDILGDIDGILPRVERALRELEARGRGGKTLRNYSEALRALCHWCIARGYLLHDPLASLAPFNGTPKIRRRLLTRAERERLLEVAPPERRLLYQVTLTTGLRAGELRALTVADMNTDLGGLSLSADWTKNRRAGLQPLPAALLQCLSEASQGKSPEAPLLDVPTHTARSLGQDLKAAGIPKWTPDGKLDFHALRNAFVSSLLDAGARVKEAQVLARHADPQLTMNVYARADRGRLTGLVEEIGRQVLTPESTTRAQRKAAGAESLYLPESYGEPAEGLEPDTTAKRIQSHRGRKGADGGRSVSHPGQQQRDAQKQRVRDGTVPDGSRTQGGYPASTTSAQRDRDARAEACPPDLSDWSALPEAARAAILRTLKKHRGRTK